MTAQKKFIIGLDIGTSSIKGILVASDGSERYTARVPFVYTCPENGGVEIPAEKYLEACFTLLKELSARFPGKGEIVGVSAASASGNLLLLDDNNVPVTPIHNWQDKRVTDETEHILGDFDTDAYFRSTGWAFDKKTFPLAMLCWYKYHHPEILASCGKVCMSTEYLYYRLTGMWGIGTSAGTPFYLIDQVTGTYNADILEQLGIDACKLPPVGKTGSVLGTVTEEASVHCGLPVGTPVILGTFDHPSAARGVGICREGQLLLSCGTSWVGFYPVQEREKAVAAKMLIDPFLSDNGGPWGGMVSLASLSGQIESFTRTYVDNSDTWFRELVDQSAKSTFGAGGLSINLLEAPDDAEIRKYEKRHIARAIMENTVNMLAARMAEIAKSGIVCEEAVMVGGPSESPLWAELIAEKTGMRVKVMHGAYAGAVGAAVLAGTALGLYPDQESACAALQDRG
ncbi:MAG: FGGY-family carbohydrate kinase [Clostridia bacterium]|nr:FGGY-family carbohydrate kinase [Clostridia bacterium]